MALPWGSIISAGGNLAGGIVGSILGNNAAKTAWKQQKKFAQNSVQWRVEDAQKAGIHPVYALGGGMPQYSPMSVGDGGLASGIANAGQYLGAAADNIATQGDKTQKMLRALSIERAELENDLLRSQIARNNQPGWGPGLPGPPTMPGAGPFVNPQPLDRTVSRPGAPDQEPYDVSDRGWTRTRTGGYAPHMSEDAKRRLEDDFLGMVAWNIRNRIVPMFKSGFGGEISGPSHVKLKPGQYWRYDWLNNQYILEERVPPTKQGQEFYEAQP